VWRRVVVVVGLGLVLGMGLVLEMGLALLARCLLGLLLLGRESLGFSMEKAVDFSK
jgi:hypothetical protein